MSLSFKWKCRKFLLGSLYCLVSATSLLIFFAWVKMEKLYQFAGWMYHGDMNNPGVWNQVHTVYWNTEVLPILYWIPAVLIFDLITRRYYAKA